jgi:DNA-binding CsgD family transcriptional regulator
MIAYAARHPERVRRLVLYGAYADGPALSEPDLQMSLLRLTRAHWGLASRTLADVFISGADEEAQRTFAAVLKAAASADAGVRRLAECFRTDVRPLLGHVHAPTLVLHRSDDRNVRVEHGRAVAAGIAGARFVELEGRSHVWYVGDMESVLAPIQAFLGDPVRMPKSDSPLSARERQVAALISDGLSNGEVAAKLEISARTAEAHAEHIRNKLGFRSRAEIAAWAVKNQNTR